MAAVLVLGGRGLIRRPEMVALPAVAGALLAVTVFAFGTEAAVTNGWTATRVYLNGVELEKWKVWPYSQYLR